MEQNKGFKSFLCSGAGRVGMIIVFYAVFLLLITLLYNVFNGSSYVMLAASIIFVFFGWQALNKITPDIFLFMPIVGWLIYFFVKLLLSVMVGFFVAPFILSRKVVNAIQGSITKGDE